MDILNYYFVKIPSVIPSPILFVIALFIIFLVIPSVLVHRQYFKKLIANKLVLGAIAFLLILFFSAITDFDEIKAYRLAGQYGWQIEDFFYPKQEAVFLDPAAFYNEDITKYISSFKNRPRFFNLSDQEAISAMICSEMVDLNVYPYINKPIKLYSFQSVVSPSIELEGVLVTNVVDVLIGIYNHNIVFAALVAHLPHYHYLPINYTSEEIIRENTNEDNYYILDTAGPEVYKSTTLAEFEANCRALNIPENIKLHDANSFFIRSKGRLASNQFDNQIAPTY